MTWCLLSCRPSRPCHRAGCPNAVEIAVGNSAYGNMTLEAQRNTVRGHGRVSLGTDNTTRRGDQDIYLNDNKVFTRGARDQVKMGTGNSAGRNMRMNISGNNIGA